jgi:hypothetical protein
MPRDAGSSGNDPGSIDLGSVFSITGDRQVSGVGAQAHHGVTASGSSASTDEVLRDLESFLVSLAHREDVPDRDVIRRSAEVLGNEVSSRRPRAAVIHERLRQIAEGVADDNALTNIVNDLAAKLSQIV